MDAKECIKSRRSVRRFTDRVITHEEFEQLIDLAKMAPTWRIHRRFVMYLFRMKQRYKKLLPQPCLDLNIMQRQYHSARILLY